MQGFYPKRRLIIISVGYREKSRNIFILGNRLTAYLNCILSDAVIFQTTTKGLNQE